MWAQIQSCHGTVMRFSRPGQARAKRAKSTDALLGAVFDQSMELSSKKPKGMSTLCRHVSSARLLSLLWERA